MLVFPEFTKSDFDVFISRGIEITQGQKFRLHITRETDYGDRYKLFVFESETAGSSSAKVGTPKKTPINITANVSRFMVAS